MLDIISNYRPGALWKTRQDIHAVCEDGKNYIIRKKQIIMVLKIIEEFNYTHLKILYKNKIYYILDLEDISINFFYDPESVFNAK